MHDHDHDHDGGNAHAGHSHRRHLPPIHMIGHLWSSSVNHALMDLVDPRPGEHVLDIGAGLGPATMTAAKRVSPGGRVVAVDPSAFMRRVESLRRLAQRARGAIDIRAGAAERLPVPDASIGAAWALNAMHHFDDLDRVAPELARVLGPGGRLVLVDEDFTHPEHTLHKGFGDHGHGPEFIDHEHFVTLLTQTGLSEASSDHRRVGGNPAFVITATQPG